MLFFANCLRLDVGLRNVLIFWMEVPHYCGYHLACRARDRFRAAISKPKSHKAAGSATDSVPAKRPVRR
jgi:hypothetical protein